MDAIVQDPDAATVRPSPKHATTSAQQLTLNTPTIFTPQTLVNILEGVLKPESLSNKGEQGLFEMYFVFAAIWAFGGALVDKDGINYRRNFDKWWKQTWTTVKLPGK